MWFDRNLDKYLRKQLYISDKKVQGFINETQSLPNRIDGKLGVLSESYVAFLPKAF